MPTEAIMARSPSGYDIFDFSDDSSSGEEISEAERNAQLGQLAQRDAQRDARAARIAALEAQKAALETMLGILDPRVNHA